MSVHNINLIGQMANQTAFFI